MAIKGHTAETPKNISEKCVQGNLDFQDTVQVPPIVIASARMCECTQVDQEDPRSLNQFDLVS